MGYNPYLHWRRSIRLPGFDYAAAGAYFVTLCVAGRECLFGKVVNGAMVLNAHGQAVAETWQWLERNFPGVELDAWVVMPNHIHGVLLLAGDEGPSRQSKPLGRLIGAFKTVSTKRLNVLRGTPGAPLWQRNYWEHVIRNEADWDRIREYIEGNPGSWATDSLHPTR